MSEYQDTLEYEAYRADSLAGSLGLDIHELLRSTPPLARSLRGNYFVVASYAPT